MLQTPTLDQSAGAQPAPDPQTITPDKKPVSAAKLEANRRNAQLSTGPTSPEGRRRSSLNGTRHSLTGQIVCLTAEDLAAFNAHNAQILAQLAPAGPLETFYATSCAENMWRLARARSLENSAFANGFRAHVDSIHSGHPEVDAALAQAQTWSEQAHQLHLLTIYESRIHRTLDKDMVTLRTLQSERKTAGQQAREQAILLMEHAEEQGQTYDPADDFSYAASEVGFAFSTGNLVLSIDDLKRHRDRQLRLAAAQSAHFTRNSGHNSAA
ncbi:MAG TPA: hypothetical protein VHW24_14845 [Bryobacteraceae bacterium]|nr:hypothetical protein [Bryobacteraceae bacterium]